MKNKTKRNIKNSKRLSRKIGGNNFAKIKDFYEFKKCVKNYDNIETINKYGNISDWQFRTFLNKMDFAFANQPNLENINFENWNCSFVVSMKNMFQNADNVSGKLFKSDVFMLNDTRNMFNGCRFSPDFTIEHWQINNLRIMDNMFENSENFNCNISNWNVDNVVSMNNAFKNCKEFNCDLNNWNVSKVTGFKGTFSGCDNFNVLQNCYMWYINYAKINSSVKRLFNNNELELLKHSNILAIIDSLKLKGQELTAENLQELVEFVGN